MGSVGTRTGLICGAAFFMGALIWGTGAGAATFNYIGFGEVTDMSPDGGIIVGSNYADGTNGVWDHGSYQAVSIPPPYVNGGPLGISIDGSTLVGVASINADAEAVRWVGLNA